MSVMKILIWPHPKLQTVSNVVTSPVNPTLVQEMFKSMSFAGGVGLSAIQIGIPERVVVARIPIAKPTIFDTSSHTEYVWVNPTWKPVEGVVKVPTLEGCLSTPGQFDTVLRFPTIIATWQDPNTLATMEARLEGLAAQVMQHESEHLEGKIFVEHLNSANRSRIKGAMLAFKKRHP